MVVRIPERKYMEVLIAGRISPVLFADDLSMHKIALPSEKIILAIHDELVASNPEYFSQDVEPDPDWLKDTGLSPMFYYRWKKPTDASIRGCDGAFRMLGDPRMLKYMHLLSFAGITQEDIELILNSKYNISYEPEDFQVFFKYFANYTGWSYNDKELYSDSITDPDMRKQFKTAIKGERAQLIWELGLGADPNLSFGELLQDMFTDSYFFFKKNLKLRPDDAQKFAALAVKISDRLEGIKDKESDAQDFISQLKINLTNQESRPDNDRKQTIVNASDMNIEIPTPTSQSIPNLEDIMVHDGAVKSMENPDD
jgi:hypothetical protein